MNKRPPTEIKPKTIPKDSGLNLFLKIFLCLITRRNGQPKNSARAI